jgi:HEAT repeat protein
VSTFGKAKLLWYESRDDVAGFIKALGDQELDIRDRARYWLVVRGERVVPSLLSAINDSDFVRRRGAQRALQQIVERERWSSESGILPEVNKRLIAMLSSDDPSVRQNATELLGRMGQPTLLKDAFADAGVIARRCLVLSVARLCEDVELDTGYWREPLNLDPKWSSPDSCSRDVHIREFCELAIRDADATVQTMIGAALLRGLIDDAKYQLTTSVLAGLGGTLPCLLRSLAAESDPYVRYLALGTCATIRDAWALDLLCEGFRASEPIIKERVIRIVTSRHDENEVVSAAVPLLIGTLHDGCDKVVGAAASGLWRLGDPRAIEPLAALLAHTNPGIRRKVAAALLRFDYQPGIEQIAEVMRTETQMFAAMGGRGDQFDISGYVQQSVAFERIPCSTRCSGWPACGGG